MARKKNYKDGELEKEFEYYKFFHKIITVQALLLNLNKEKVEELVGTSVQEDVEAFVDELVENLTAKHFEENDDAELDMLYGYCWKQIIGKISDNANFTSEVKYKA